MLIKDVYASCLHKIENTNIEPRALTLLLESFLELNNWQELHENANSHFPNLPNFEMLFARLLNGEPVQYILKKAWFYGKEFYVDQNVLIPRMETEELVDLIIKENSSRQAVIGDIGTGSGIIAISLARHLPNSRIYASDISVDALMVAQKNAAMHNCDITFMQGNMVQPFIEKKINLDIIVSNPPYINRSDEIDDLVINNEPLLALIPPSGDGLEYYKIIINDARHLLNSRGLIYFEIGDNLKEGLEIFLREFNIKYQFYKDISNRNRILKISFE